MKKLFAVLLAFAVVFAFAACGEEKTVTEEPSSSTEAVSAEPETELVLPEPAANVNPEEMDWGWNDYTEEKFENLTSDIWYPVTAGVNELNYIYLENGHAIYKIENGEEAVSGWILSEENHAIPDPEYTEFSFDIVFIDNFTLYDYTTETYYTRGELSKYIKLFEGIKFTCATDEGRAIEFKAEGIADYYYRGEPTECKWEVSAQRIITLTFADYSDGYYVFFNDDGSVKCISENSSSLDNAYFPA